jgi:hypothetical protein
MQGQEKVDYKEMFDNERAEWTEKIQVVSLNLKDIKTVAKAQVDLFSYRQILLEYSFKLAGIISKLNSRYRNDKSRKLREYSENTDVRYGANEKTVLIEGDLIQVTEKIEIVEGHRKFIDQTVQTVDHMLYGIRHRIMLEDYLRGNSAGRD